MQPAGGGTAGEAISVGEAQMGKPFAMGTDGPGTFSCSGLMRFIMRTIGVDADAPWVPEGYLSKYAPVAPGNLQPGDIVIYPNWATMYVGNGMLLDANEDLGYVTHTPMDVAGTPEGIVRPPYGGGGGQSQGSAAPLLSSGVDPQQGGKVDPPAGTAQYDAGTMQPSGAVNPQPQSGAVDPPAGTAQYDAAGGGTTQPPQDGTPLNNTGMTTPQDGAALQGGTPPLNAGTTPQDGAAPLQGGAPPLNAGTTQYNTGL